MIEEGMALEGVPDTVAVKLTRVPARATGLETVSVTWVWATAQSAQASSNRKITRRFMVPSRTRKSRVKTIFGPVLRATL
jgi:hypothetical protein